MNKAVASPHEGFLSMARNQLPVRCYLRTVNPHTCVWAVRIDVCFCDEANKLHRVMYLDSGEEVPLGSKPDNCNVYFYDKYPDSPIAAVKEIWETWREEGHLKWLTSTLDAAYWDGKEDGISLGHYLLIPHYARFELSLRHYWGKFPSLIHHRFVSSAKLHSKWQHQMVAKFRH